MQKRTSELIKRIIENKGINIQMLGLDRPKSDENTLKLYIVDEKYGLKEFAVTNSISDLINRKTNCLVFGTTKSNGKKIGVVLVWER